MYVWVQSRSAGNCLALIQSCQFLCSNLIITIWSISTRPPQGLSLKRSLDSTRTRSWCVLSTSGCMWVRTARSIRLRPRRARLIISGFFNPAEQHRLFFLADGFNHFCQRSCRVDLESYLACWFPASMIYKSCVTLDGCLNVTKHLIYILEQLRWVFWPRLVFVVLCNSSLKRDRFHLNNTATTLRLVCHDYRASLKNMSIGL